MLDNNKIRELIKMMAENNLVEITLRDGEEEVSLRRPNPASPSAVPQLQMVPTQPIPPGIDGLATESLPLPSASADEEVLIEIASPMVGTFYTASDPESAPFVEVGTKIQSGMVVCILEAMKVFNEIKAEISGTIERTLVNNADTVEFGQPLFLVRPL